jgi:hypothetical protein
MPGLKSQESYLLQKDVFQCKMRLQKIFFAGSFKLKVLWKIKEFVHLLCAINSHLRLFAVAFTKGYSSYDRLFALRNSMIFYITIALRGKI